MTQDYAALANKAMEDINFLKKLKIDVDPASCMSVSVRLGVPQDNPSDEEDSDRRPWRTMEFRGVDAEGDAGVNSTGNMRKFIDLLIADRIDSLKLWVRCAAEESIRQNNASARGTDFLLALSKEMK